jgi:hypothetical protein
MNDQQHLTTSQELTSSDAPPYAPPEILDLGKAEDLVLGSWDGMVPEFWPPYGLWC